MAAQALLEMVFQDDDGHEAVRVTDDDATRLQSTNFKGTLLEWCAKYKMSPPRFERGASPEGYRIRAFLSVHDQEEIATVWYVAPKLKTAEQAAAEAVLQQLPSEPAAETRQDAQLIEPPVEPTPEAPSGRNAAMVLNELAQVGLLQATGYELLDETGPSHQPTFSIVAWATLPDSRTVRTEPSNASSKKSGQQAAADRLLDLLVHEGITRR